MPQVFSAYDLPSDPRRWPKFRKTVTTPAIRIDGPFTVETREGPLRCADGWLAVDAGGQPYPIADEEFQRIYEQVDG